MLVGVWLPLVAALQNLSSGLARTAAVERLCHSFQAFHTTYSDTGLLGVYFVTDKHHIDDMMFTVQNAWWVESCAHRVTADY